MPIGVIGQAAGINIFIRHFKNIVELAGADKRIDLGQLLHQIVAIALYQAAGNDDALRLPFALSRVASRIASTDSCLADSINPQVLTTIVSASSSLFVIW